MLDLSPLLLLFPWRRCDQKSKWFLSPGNFFRGESRKFSMSPFRKTASCTTPFHRGSFKSALSSRSYSVSNIHSTALHVGMLDFRTTRWLNWPKLFQLEELIKSGYYLLWFRSILLKNLTNFLQRGGVEGWGVVIPISLGKDTNSTILSNYAPNLCL